MIKPLAIFACVFCVFGIALAAPNEAWKRLERRDFGKKWPLTVETGEVGALNPRKLRDLDVVDVVFKVNGKTYGVNGTARGTKKYLDIKEIWAENPEIPGTKIDLSPIIDAGLKLAGQK